MGVRVCVCVCVFSFKIGVTFYAFFGSTFSKYEGTKNWVNKRNPLQKHRFHIIIKTALKKTTQHKTTKQNKTKTQKTHTFDLQTCLFS